MKSLSFAAGLCVALCATGNAISQDFTAQPSWSAQGPMLGSSVVFETPIATPSEVETILRLQATRDPASLALDAEVFESLQSGRALVFGTSNPAEMRLGLHMLEAAAAAGSGEAALTIGIAADMGLITTMGSETSYQWYEQGAIEGNEVAELFMHRADLYSAREDRAVQQSIAELLRLYDDNTIGAARDIAKIYGYGWEDPASSQVVSNAWAQAISSNDPIAYLDYAKFISAGGIQIESGPSSQDIAEFLSESTYEWGPIFAADYLRSSDIAPTPIIDALVTAHNQGNFEATARLGEAYVLGFGEAGQTMDGVGLLEAAAQRGVPMAYSALGAYYLESPDPAVGRDTGDALELLRMGLQLGDGDAAVTLSRYELTSGRPSEAFDLTMLGDALGTARTASEALEVRESLCPADRDYSCETAVVAFATSRATDLSSGKVNYTNIPNGNFEHSFGFAEVLVPVQVDAGEQRRGLLSMFSHWVRQRIGWPTRPPDQFEGSKTHFSAHVDWPTFLSGLQFGGSVLSDQEETEKYLLFVHGFNFSIEGAVAAAARLKLGANIPGLPILYSWPSGQQMVRMSSSQPFYFGYDTDVTMAARNCEAFQSFVVELAKAVGPENLTIIAHSHGAQLVQSALTTCDGSRPDVERVPPGIRSVVYGAPDIDSDLFARHVPQVVEKVGNVTIYASSADVAMYGSGDVLRGGQKRAGSGGPNRTVVDGVDTVDLSSLAAYTRSDNGHGYLFTMPAVLRDVADLLRHNMLPHQRCLVARPHGESGLNYWEFRHVCAL